MDLRRQFQIPIPAKPAPSTIKEAGSGTFSPLFVMTVSDIKPFGLHVPAMGFSEQPYPKMYEPFSALVPTTIGVWVRPRLYINAYRVKLVAAAIPLFVSPVFRLPKFKEPPAVNPSELNTVAGDGVLKPTKVFVVSPQEVPTVARERELPPTVTVGAGPPLYSAMTISVGVNDVALLPLKNMLNALVSVMRFG